MFGKRAILLVIVLVCTCVAFAVGLYRAGVIGSRFDSARQAAAERSEFIESRRKAGERGYAELPMREVDASITADAVTSVYVSLYREAARNAGVALSERDVAAVAQLASEFIYYRFFGPSPDGYIEWMDRSGYQWIDEKQMRASMVAEDWAYFYPDEGFPGFESPREVFSRFWHRQEGEEFIRVVGVSDDPGAVAMAAATAQGPDLLYPTPTDTAEMVWSGQVGTMRRWFKPRSHDYRKLAQQPQPVQLATAGFVVEREDGRRDPLALFLYKGPVGKWYIRAVVGLNLGRGAPVAQEM